MNSSHIRAPINSTRWALNPDTFNNTVNRAPPHNYVMYIQPVPVNRNEFPSRRRFVFWRGREWAALFLMTFNTVTTVPHWSLRSHCLTNYLFLEQRTFLKPFYTYWLPVALMPHVEYIPGSIWFFQNGITTICIRKFTFCPAWILLPVLVNLNMWHCKYKASLFFSVTNKSKRMQRYIFMAIQLRVRNMRIWMLGFGLYRIVADVDNYCFSVYHKHTRHTFHA